MSVIMSKILNTISFVKQGTLYKIGIIPRNNMEKHKNRIRQKLDRLCWKEVLALKQGLRVEEKVRTF